MNGRAGPAWLMLQAAAIVGSILLAFAIDAWWENRQERELEFAAMVSLHRDLEKSRADLDVALATFADWHDRFAQFDAATPAELAQLEEAKAGPILTSLYPGMTFDPTSATLHALVSDGRLAIIEDAELRSALARWLHALADIGENEDDIRAGALRAQIATEKHGGPFLAPAAVPGRQPDLGNLRPATGAALAALRDDPEFMGRARSHQLQTAFYVRELRILSEILDANLALLAERISEGG